MLQTCFGSSEAFGVWIPGWQGKVLSVGDVQMLEGGKENLQSEMSSFFPLLAFKSLSSASS